MCQISQKYNSVTYISSFIFEIKNDFFNSTYNFLCALTIQIVKTCTTVTVTLKQ